MARFTRVFGVRQLRVGFVRGLRFRLAVSYVAFFAILLAAIGFFALMIVTVVGTARGLLHENYLPLPVLVPFLITSFVLALVVRGMAFHIERVRPAHHS